MPIYHVAETVGNDEAGGFAAKSGDARSHRIETTGFTWALEAFAAARRSDRAALSEVLMFKTRPPRYFLGIVCVGVEINTRKRQAPPLLPTRAHTAQTFEPRVPISSALRIVSRGTEFR
jgi:hypothetical protein